MAVVLYPDINFAELPVIEIWRVDVERGRAIVGVVNGIVVPAAAVIAIWANKVEVSSAGKTVAFVEIDYRVLHANSDAVSTNLAS